MNLDDLFNLDIYPNYPVESLKSIKEYRKDIDIRLKSAENDYKNDSDPLFDIKEAININTKSIKEIIILESIIDDYKYAYESLVDFVTRLIDEEKIDIRKYTNDITEDDWKKLTRKERIKKILKNL